MVAGAQGSRSHGIHSQKQREMNAHFLIPIQFGTPAHGIMSPTVRVCLLSFSPVYKLHRSF